MGKSGFCGDFFVDFMSRKRYVYVNGLDNPEDYYEEPSIPWFYYLERNIISSIGSHHLFRVHIDSNCSPTDRAILNRRFKTGQFTKPIDPPYQLNWVKRDWLSKLKHILKNPTTALSLCRTDYLDLEYVGVYEDEIVSKMLHWASGKRPDNLSLPDILERYFYNEMYPKWHNIIKCHRDKTRLMLTYRYLCQGSIHRTIQLKAQKLAFDSILTQTAVLL
jgi:hypothetical protein